MRRTRVEVDLAAIRRNAAALHEIAGERLYGVVKADAYGHGAVPVARALAGQPGVAGLAVSLIEEGIELRDAGVAATILVMNWEDRGTCILFGDGAGAVVMVPDEQTVPVTSKEARGVLSTHLGSDGTQWRELNILGGGTMHGATEQTVADKLHTLRMAGIVLGGEAARGGPGWVGGAGVARLASASRFQFVGEPRRVGSDVALTLRRGKKGP